MKTPISRGFTLLEVLIALLVLSLGLLGLAALQVQSMRNNQSANYRTQATSLAYQFIDMARSHRGAGAAGAGDARNHPNVRRLADGLDSFSDGGTGSDMARDCVGATPDALRCDRARWFNALTSQLPNGRARVTFAGMPSGMLTVEICWTDTRTGDAATTGCTGAHEGFGRPTVGDGTANWSHLGAENNALWLRSRI